ncbi:MAG TPA: thrombospondin type 3 repeat-containing protein [Kofleriaceae bacterium]|nr:thrombospondin type 3 repeat-containing protein [Kofleriaceae bacterium]
MRLRLSIVLLGVALASPAFAQQGPELSGFVGFDYFGDRVKFGDDPSYVRDLYPGTSPVLGVRFAYLWSPEGISTHFSGGFEVEGAMTPTYTQTGIAADSMKSYFAPFIGYRMHGIARLGDERFGAHLLAGMGGLTVASTSPFVTTTFTEQLYAGVGLDLRVGHVGILRADFRDAYMPAMSGGWTPTFEVQLGLTRVWGARGAPPPRVEEEEEPVATATKPAEDKDTDGDGFPDSIDKCPNEPETVNGIEDQDGCPEKDTDGDGVVDKVDKCPTEPEDKDHYQDADGCPDPDNDGDGILDAVDVCPNEPETYNGFHDDDGCPDEVPDVIKKVLSDASGVQFELGKPKIVKASQPSIRPLVGILQGQPEMRIVITAHPDKDGDKAADLARKRGEAIRFYLEDQGIAIVRNDIVVGAVAPKGPVIEVTLAVAMPPLPKATGK